MGEIISITLEALDLHTPTLKKFCNSQNGQWLSHFEWKILMHSK